MIQQYLVVNMNDMCGCLSGCSRMQQIWSICRSQSVARHPTLFCRPSKKHPSRLKKLFLQISNTFSNLVAQRPKRAISAKRQDELAQPLLHEDEQRGNAQLEDIQEVDLEAGEGSRHGPAPDRVERR